MVRGTRPTDTERTVLFAALRLLADARVTARAVDLAAPAPFLRAHGRLRTALRQHGLVSALQDWHAFGQQAGAARAVAGC